MSVKHSSTRTVKNVIKNMQIHYEVTTQNVPPPQCFITVIYIIVDGKYQCKYGFKNHFKAIK